MSSEHLTDYQKVKQFTEGAYGYPCPARPQLMTRDEVKFIVRMVLSEMSELVNTVTETEEETKQFMEECLHEDPSKHPKDRSELALIAEQGDAMCDAYYYMLNSCCKKGIDLSKIFDVVHDANMAKRDPETGKFIKRESDGKILKPAGWQPPDIQKAILDMGYTPKL